MSDSLRIDISSAIKSVTTPWKKVKRQADKDNRVRKRDLERLRRGKVAPKMSVRDAAFQVMQEAYKKASSNGRFYTTARQVMYAARPNIIEMTENNTPWKNSSYFTQNLLKDYIEQNNPDWKEKVVWDPRGHFKEPHTGKSVELGGIKVREYLKNWNSNISEFPKVSFSQRIMTVGPQYRFNSVLFIEKEGFDQILEDAGISRRFDIALMSTKGIPVGAACELASHLYKTVGVQIFVLHDFDLAGFKIVNTLLNGTRMNEGVPVIDLGLRLEDVDGLQSEPVEYKQQADPTDYLIDCDATWDECEFLVTGQRGMTWIGERVELNAMTSEQLISFLEEKFDEHDVKKLVPDKTILESSLRRAFYCQTLVDKSHEIQKNVKAELNLRKIPKDLQKSVRQLLENNEKYSWDEAIWEIAAEMIEEKSNKNHKKGSEEQ